MKKLKFLPTILMLVLCVGVLAIGIYAITPTKNTIDGSITINASNSPVSVELFIDGESQGEPQTVRSTKNWEIGELVLNASKANSIEQVKDRIITFKVSNLSNKALGVYFLNPDSTLPTVDEKDGETITHHAGTAKLNNVMIERDIHYDGATPDKENLTTKIATAYFTPYYFLGADDGDTTGVEYDSVDMNITFEAYQFFTDSKSYDFKYQLNVEPYYGNVDNDDFVDTLGEYEDPSGQPSGKCNITEGLIKFSENVTEIPKRAFYGNQLESCIVVIPSYVTSFETYRDYMYDMDNNDAFKDFNNMLAVSVNTTIPDYSNFEPIIPFNFKGTLAINVNFPKSLIGGGEYSSGCAGRIELSSNITAMPQYSIYYATCDTFIISKNITSLNNTFYTYPNGYSNSRKIIIMKGLDLDYAVSLVGAPYKEGYEFVCWYEAGTGNLVTEISAAEYTETTMYYAYYKIK